MPSPVAEFSLSRGCFLNHCAKLTRLLLVTPNICRVLALVPARPALLPAPERGVGILEEVAGAGYPWRGGRGRVRDGVLHTFAHSGSPGCDRRILIFPARF